MESLPFVGMGISAFGDIKAGDSANAAGMYARDQYNAEAKATRQAGEYESLQQRKTAERASATEVANTYAQGGTLTGSKLIDAADNAKNMEADARMIMRNSQLKATGLKQQGAFMRWQGKDAQIASRIQAAADLTGGAGKQYQYKMMAGGSGSGQVPTSTNDPIPGSE